jgi:hypothetical protein
MDATDAYLANLSPVQQAMMSSSSRMRRRLIDKQIDLHAMQSAAFYSMNAQWLVSHQICTKKYSDPALLDAEGSRAVHVNAVDRISANYRYFTAHTTSTKDPNYDPDNFEEYGNDDTGDEAEEFRSLGGPAGGRVGDGEVEYCHPGCQPLLADRETAEPIVPWRDIAPITTKVAQQLKSIAFVGAGGTNCQLFAAYPMQLAVRVIRGRCGHQRHPALLDAANPYGGRLRADEQWLLTVPPSCWSCRCGWTTPGRPFATTATRTSRPRSLWTRARP